MSFSSKCIGRKFGVDIHNLLGIFYNFDHSLMSLGQDVNVSDTEVYDETSAKLMTFLLFSDLLCVLMQISKCLHGIMTSLKPRSPTSV